MKPYWPNSAAFPASATEMRSGPHWPVHAISIGEAVALAAHEALLAEFGGLPGIRDRNALGSALARPRNLAGYGSPDAAALAASYAFGLIRNHPFADGNKRVGYALALVFLLDNGCVFTGTDLESVQTILALAAGDLTEDDVAAWFRARLSAED